MNTLPALERWYIPILVLLIGCSPRDSLFEVAVVSSPPEQVSGGKARLEVHLPPGVDPADLSAEVKGNPVDLDIRVDSSADMLDVRVSGLPEGESIIVLQAGDYTNRVRVVNHAVTGPISSGLQQEPFFCATEEHRTRAGLGEILDEHCSIATVVSFVYLSKNSGTFEPFDPSGPRPTDLARTLTTEGDSVDFIVRWERGTINRFIYSIALLSPSLQEIEQPDLSGWNKKLIYYFQGGVGIGHYQGAPSVPTMLYKHGLGKGYAVAYSTGTSTGVHYDLEVGGETAIMVKSHFVTTYGRPEYTVGLGGSGGGIQQYVYGQNHPGLLDAAIPQYAYPDMVTQTIHIGDCELLERYMDAEVEKNPDSKWTKWTNRTWLEGLAASDTLNNEYNGDRPGLTECINGWRGLSPLSLNPHYGTAPGITPEQQETVHWSHYEDLKQVYGMADDGYAARAWDNVGVQYGLKALVNGHITPEEFLDLNARIGSWKNEPEMIQEGAPFVENGAFDPHSKRNMNLSPDDSGHPPAPRAEADPGAIEGLYRHKMIFLGDIDIPIIDWRNYLEPFLDMHNTHQSFSTRKRMLNHDGDASNQVIWFTGARSMEDRFDQTPMAFEVIDEWMGNIKAHPERSVAENKPERAVDSCFDERGALIYAGNDAWAGILDERDEGKCTRLFPLYGTSRTVAGGPITGDVFKCQLQSVESALQKGVYDDWNPTPEQVEQLKEIFPQGVCDYSKPDASRPEGI